VSYNPCFRNTQRFDERMNADRRRLHVRTIFGNVGIAV
jgi:hypothetical protein